MACLARSISVVVPTFNRRRKLERLLASFDSLQGDHVEEVIVVDDCSTDGTKGMSLRWVGERHRFAARYLRMQTNGGPAVARNAGMKKASGEVIAFTDDDCVVHPRWLLHLVEPLDPAHKVVGTGGAVLPVHTDVISRYYTFHHILEPAPSLLYLVTANCCYTRDLALAVGGFDPDLPTPGGEDVGLSFRLYKRGYRFAMADGAVVYHDYRKDLFDFYRTFRNYGRGCRYVTEKYFGKGVGTR